MKKLVATTIIAVAAGAAVLVTRSQPTRSEFDLPGLNTQVQQHEARITNLEDKPSVTPPPPTIQVPLTSPTPQPSPAVAAPSAATPAPAAQPVPTVTPVPVPAPATPEVTPAPVASQNTTTSFTFDN